MNFGLPDFSQSLLGSGGNPTSPSSPFDSLGGFGIGDGGIDFGGGLNFNSADLTVAANTPSFGGIPGADGLTQNIPNVPGVLDNAAGANDFDFFSRQNFFGGSTTDANGVTTTTNGILNPIFKGIGAVSNIYFGLKGLSLAEDQFDFQKEAFEKNFAANKKAFNNAVRTKQGAVANSTSNEVLGIGPNATLAERDEAEQAYVTANSQDLIV